MRTLFSEESTRIDALRRALPALNDNSREFAEDLIAKSGVRHGLSPKQWHWVDILTQRATETPPEPAEVGIAGVVDLLDRAAKRLKHPSINVRVENRDLRLSVAGPSAQVPGSINVCSVGSFEDRQWFGRVTRDGKFEPSRRHGGDTASAIVAALKALAADPAGTAAEYGRLYGICCMCGLPLVAERSTSVGYGPVCAKNWGLPYPSSSEARCLSRQLDKAA
jgi:hypothetical protein